MSEPKSDHGNLIRNSVSQQGGGDNTFVDYKDLHPVNETVATLGGATAGGLLGSFPALLLKSHSAGVATAEHAAQRASHNGILGFGIVLGTLVGGISSYLSARTHNDWAAKVMEKVNHNQSQGRSS